MSNERHGAMGGRIPSGSLGRIWSTHACKMDAAGSFSVWEVGKYALVVPKLDSSDLWVLKTGWNRTKMLVIG